MGLTKEPKIGDRFKRTRDTIEYLGNGEFLNLDTKTKFQQNYATQTWAVYDYEYIGNFSKSNQFKTIYQILNEEL